jgi:hypothetical protein
MISRCACGLPAFPLPLVGGFLLIDFGLRDSDDAAHDLAHPVE